jgi:hypothetical protein
VADFTPEELAGVDASLPELPERYDELRVVLLARDPGWLYAYWDLSTEVRERLSARQGALALRLHDVTDLEFDGAHSWWKSLHWVPPESSHAYLPAPAAGRAYLVELGLYEEAGEDRLAPRFLPLVRSDGAHAPEAGPSMISDEVFTALPAQGPPRPPEVVPALPLRQGEGELGSPAALPREPSTDSATAWDPDEDGPQNATCEARRGAAPPAPGNGHGLKPLGAPGRAEEPPPWSGVQVGAPSGPNGLEGSPPWSALHVSPPAPVGPGDDGQAGEPTWPLRGHPA